MESQTSGKKRFLHSPSNFSKDIRFVFNKQLFQVAKFPALAVPPTASAALGQCLTRSRSVVLRFTCFLFFFFPAVLCKANVLIWFGGFAVLQAVYPVWTMSSGASCRLRGFSIFIHFLSCWWSFLWILLMQDDLMFASGAFWRTLKSFTKSVAAYGGNGLLLLCFIAHKCCLRGIFHL